MKDPFKPILEYRPPRRRYRIRHWTRVLSFILSMILLCGAVLWIWDKPERSTITSEYSFQVKADPQTSISATSAYHTEPVTLTSRGSDRSVMMECTAYTLRPCECGKEPGDPGYGITASGAPVKPWHTIAASREVPFGTRVFIPFFKDKPNQGIFIVQDRGGAITEGHLDVYMEDLTDALAFGRRTIEVYIFGEV